MKRCPSCKATKPYSEFYKKGDAYYCYCRECSRARTSRWYRSGGREKALARVLEIRLRDPEAKRKQYREWAWNRKLEAIAHYGGRCECCGEAEPKFLALDHKDNDGNKHRKLIGNVKIYTWLKKNDWPDNFQILCHNCNMAKAFWKICPHQQGEAEGWVSDGKIIN